MQWIDLRRRSSAFCVRIRQFDSIMPSNSSALRHRAIILAPLATLSTHGIIGSSTCRGALSFAPGLHVHGGRRTCSRLPISVQNARGTRPIANVRFMSNADANNDEEPLCDLPRHTVTFRSAAGKSDIAFEATDGEVLRTACLRRGLVSPHNGNARLINCRGLGTCGTCAVEIEGGTPGDESPPIEPTQRNNVENLRLQFPPHGSGDQSPKLRLACQVQVRGDIVVTKRKGFWGQASGSCDASEEETTMVDPSECQTYFGELEYLLDRRSPQKSTGGDNR